MHGKDLISEVATLALALTTILTSGDGASLHLLLLHLQTLLPHSLPALGLPLHHLLLGGDVPQDPVDGGDAGNGLSTADPLSDQSLPGLAQSRYTVFVRSCNLR